MQKIRYFDQAPSPGRPCRNVITVAYLGPMKILTFFLLLAGLYSTANAQTAADTAATQIRQLLKPGKHLVHYFRANPNKQLRPSKKC